MSRVVEGDKTFEVETEQTYGSDLFVRDNADGSIDIHTSERGGGCIGVTITLAEAKALAGWLQGRLTPPQTDKRP